MVLSCVSIMNVVARQTASISFCSFMQRNKALRRLVKWFAFRAGFPTTSNRDRSWRVNACSAPNDCPSPFTDQAQPLCRNINPWSWHTRPQSDFCVPSMICVVFLQVPPRYAMSIWVIRLTEAQGSGEKHRKYTRMSAPAWEQRLASSTTNIGGILPAMFKKSSRRSNPRSWHNLVLSLPIPTPVLCITACT